MTEIKKQKKVRHKTTPPGQTGFKAVERNYRRNAENRGIRFDLTSDELLSFFLQDCTYCGAEPSAISTGCTKDKDWSQFIYNGIDRINNSLGYTRKNCTPCCKTCNAAKGKRNKKDFLKWVLTVAAHNSK